MVTEEKEDGVPKGQVTFCRDPRESSPLCLITRVCRSCVGHSFGKCYFCHLNYDDMKTLVKKDKVELSIPYQLKIHKWVIFPVTSIPRHGVLSFLAVNHFNSIYT